jgi:hypothetical protein
LFRPAERERLPVLKHLNRAEQPKLHTAT